MERSREFYRIYPQISQSVTAELPAPGIGPEILQLSTAQLQSIENNKVTDMSPFAVQLARHFSFTHFVELMRIADPLKRAF